MAMTDSGVLTRIDSDIVRVVDVATSISLRSEPA